MDELLEEDPSESLGPENTAVSPNVGPTNNLEEDNQKNQSKGNADDHTESEDTGYVVHYHSDKKSSESPDDKTSSQANDITYRQIDLVVPDLTDRTAEQVDHRLSSQADRRALEQVNRRSSNQPDRRASEQADHRGPSQTDRRTSEPVGHTSYSQANKRPSEQADYSQSDRRVSDQVDRKMSSQANKRASEQLDHRLSSQAKGLVSQQIEDTLSMLSNGGASENDQHRTSDQKTSEQLVSNLSSLAEKTEKASLILSDQDGLKTDKEFHQVYDHATQPTEQQAVYQDDINTDEFMVDKGVYSEEYHADNFISTQPDQQGNYLSFYRALDEFEFSQQDEQNNYRMQPCKFEPSQFLSLQPKFSMTIESEKPTTSQAFVLDDAGFTNYFQELDQAFDSKFPSILSKLDSDTSQEDTQATKIKSDDFSEFKQEKTQTPKGRFHPIVYEDPYEASLQYMEEHNILQIFQITENLVFERPEDPLHFMLCQVQQMIKNRSKK
ncbi:uncharacterized protein C3orf30 homolog isoform X2 [Octodon degus]|uniref:Uncharacterized protein C3orf30 homolog isoform X2 n=1 Tax=Octodon degus TaxID=10160 RepID=A0A6P6EM79_OCTDE|nr:uncharacterized protein C3orf30 homolog isoform X2 [Octodon degus]